MDYSARVLKVSDHIAGHLSEPLDVEHLSKIAGISPFHFQRIFRALTGEPLMAHVRRLRLERAAQRLHIERCDVTEIALTSGYRSHEGFTRAFRARFGCAPVAWRGRRVPFAQAPPPVRIDTLPERRLCVLRHLGPYAGVSATWAQLIAWLERSRSLPRVRQWVGLSHDEPGLTDDAHIRYDAGVVMHDPPLPPQPIRSLVLPAGRYATLRHTGPMASVGETYRALFRGWIAARGLRVAHTPPVEIYLDPLGAPGARVDVGVRLEEGAAP